MCLHTEQSSWSQLHSQHVSVGMNTHTHSCEGIGYQMTQQTGHAGYLWGGG